MGLRDFYTEKGFPVCLAVFRHVLAVLLRFAGSLILCLASSLQVVLYYESLLYLY